MQNKRTILFLTGKYTTDVADAICERLAKSNENMGIVVNQRELESNFEIFVLDKLFPLDSKIRRGMRNAYLRYKDSMPDKKIVQAIGFKNNNALHNHIFNAITRYTPDLVVVTSDTVLNPTLSSIHKLGKNTKVVVICDSFVLDKRLINRNVDYYFVDNFDIRNQLIEGGIGEDRIEIAAIPLKRAANDKLNKEEAINKMGLDANKKTVLVSCGNDGDDRFKKVITALSDANLNANIIVACSKNVTLLNLARNKGLIAYNEGINMHVALTACDLLITKSNVTLIAEAINKKKLVFGILPSTKKETIQLDYLSTDTIVKIDNEENLIKKVTDYIGDLETGAETEYEEIFKLLNEREYVESTQIIADKLLAMVDRERDFLVKSQNT